MREREREREREIEKREEDTRGCMSVCMRMIALIYIYIECGEMKFIIPLYRENRKRSTLIIARVSNKY